MCFGHLYVHDCVVTFVLVGVTQNILEILKSIIAVVVRLKAL